MGTKHGKLMRGMDAAGHHQKNFNGIFGARFGRLFPKSKAAKFGRSQQQTRANLSALANAMI